MSETSQAALAVFGFFGMAWVLAIVLRGMRATLALVITLTLAAAALILAGILRAPALDWAAGLLFIASAVLRYTVDIASWASTRRSCRRRG